VASTPDTASPRSTPRLLARALAGTLDPSRLGNAEQVGRARLENAGLVDEDLRVTDEVRYSLGLTS
jgi:hypothetical protein